ncbi:hypothetical protein [Glycomyces algeriensis]|uniref:Uncharacterized protein n=1 Tax=Glycomyces algeriensis TaxID=256037 RepID=A0A9W6G5A3_9ACTN|nr:hypothetical protein [Glycomyces algeriensis]MDA1366297.1 hypothetical protein [Glycomyces algeriensis]MDR7348642.1 hypothetical protein [Glycomyces algeriensis]GLI41344.1 hypothetical protein GALLR39Z86_11940 [Glycomyces algeriensis]
MADRVFDPEAIGEYRQFLVELIEELENELLPVLATGTLSRAPAFGTAPGAAANATGQYLEFHAAMWRNLQYLRGTLYGLDAALAETTSGDDPAAVYFDIGTFDPTA